MNKQAGFTLIEIIAVIVILGILSAVALPKFVNLGGEARIAKMQGAAGSVNSAAVLIHSKWLAKGSPTGAVAIEFDGGSLDAATEIINGYPAASRIAEVAGLGANDFVTAVAAGVMTAQADVDHAACAFTYSEAPANGTPVVDTATGLNDANCK